ncbi:MAG: hypothetical protein Q7S74_01640 [Nanoarchaeota archaeon]|nr:hypothetical protein [Nanoarchaeota archaeon]
MEIKEDDLVLCTVKRIEGTTVFVDIEGNGKGSLVLSEVAAGRIRNLRDYVAMNKKIVCKALRVSGDHIELSLRRVTAKEKQYVLEKNQRERVLKNILKLGVENPDDILQKIKEKYDIIDFFEEAKANTDVFSQFMTKEQAKKIAVAFAEKSEKEKFVKRSIIMCSFSDSGLDDIKHALDVKGAEIHYLGSSMFSISVSAKDFKEANINLIAIIKEIEHRSKEKKILFEVKGE